MDGKYKIDLQRGLISEWMLPFEMVRNEKKYFHVWLIWMLLYPSCVLA